MSKSCIDLEGVPGASRESKFGELIWGRRYVSFAVKASGSPEGSGKRYIEDEMKANCLAILLALTWGVSLTMAETNELPKDIHDRITALSEEGDSLAERSKYSDAIAKYQKAVEMLPPPREKWEACTWLSAAIADAYFLSGKFSQAKDTLASGMKCPGAVGNPFMHLRLGQSAFEVGEKDRAADELTRAYMAEGKEIFEQDDPKYFEFLKTRIKPPANGTW